MQETWDFFNIFLCKLSEVSSCIQSTHRVHHLHVQKFLNEEYPIKWLKLEERIKLLHNDGAYKEGDPAPIMDVQELKDLAKKCGIDSDEQQELALDFFNSCGKIIYLSESTNIICTLHVYYMRIVQYFYDFVYTISLVLYFSVRAHSSTLSKC